MPKTRPGPRPTTPPSSLNPTVAATHLFLIRHGEVERSFHRVFGGRIDMGLSPEGRRQARLMGDYLRARHFEAIYASPLKRAQQTLAPIAARRQPPPVTLPALREVDFGDWTGLNFLQVRERFGARAYEWLHHLERGAIPNGENARSLRARVEPCLRRILADHAGRTVAVVSHGGTIRMMLALLLELPLSKMSCFEVDYASLTWIEIQPHKTEIQLLNFVPWRSLS